MLKCDDFVSSREDHVMITHDGAATNSRDTDFAAFALLTLLASVIYIVICSVRCLIDGVCQCQCGAAGCVQLLVVVLLYNLDIKTCCRQSRSCFLQKLHKQVDTQRHVGGFQNSRFFGCLFDFRKLFLGKSGGAENNRGFGPYTVVQQSVRCLCV